MQEFLDQIYFNNSVLDYVIFLVSLVVSCAGVKIIGHFIIRHRSQKANKTEASIDDRIIKSIRQNILPIAYVASFYLTAKLIVLGPGITKVIDALVLGFITIKVALFVSTIVIYIFGKYWEIKAPDSRNELTLKWIGRIIKALVWGIALILFLDNIGIKVNTLVAGLGIGGLAIAFASQAILVDVFCFFTIFFDRPFEIGDFIIVGDQMGTVEHIGVKTTRLRTLGGELLIFSNTDLTNSRISNFKTLEERRVLFTLGVRYDTASDILKEIPGIIKNILENIPDTTFARTHFVSYGTYGLNFEIVYYVLNSDYDLFMDIHQEVNFRIKEEFEKWGIRFAFPTQNVHFIKE